MEQSSPTNVGICMNAALTVQLSHCSVSGTVQALWNGPMLYLLFTVTDPAISTVSPDEKKRSSVEFYVDQYDDKFPKFEEDDRFGESRSRHRASWIAAERQVSRPLRSSRDEHSPLSIHFLQWTKRAFRRRLESAVRGD
jgi:hypothetical protein